MEVRTSFLGLVIISCFLLGFPSEGNASSEGKVAVDFYSESLCPYCSSFVINDLSRIVNNGVIDIVDLRIIPYGNAQIYPTGEIVCQTKWFPFILCLEKLVQDSPQSHVYPNWKTCVEPSGVSLGLLEKCFKGPLGCMLVREFGAETDSLIPPHKYVPWVVVEGKPLYDDYEDIEKVLCQAYKGSNAPNVCERYNVAEAPNPTKSKGCCD